MKKEQMTQGFTLVEIMIVVAIIGILAAIAIPNFVKSRDESQTKACISNLKQIEGACEQIKINGFTPTYDSVADTGVGLYVKDFAALACPSDKSKLYNTTAVPGDDAHPLCPNAAAKPLHTL